jgi:DNA polymerase I-like protein with 3'-5' exonuclease and polymerase domains/5'-3' exonuclease
MISILDLRGLIIQSLHKGEDQDGGKTPSGAKLNTVGHCLNNFLTDYLFPISENSRLNEIIGVLDPTDSGSEYRKELYVDYKGNRKESEPEMSARINECQEAVHNLLKGLGIPMASAHGIEADDVIGYLVKHLPGPKLIYTVDQDLIQLASQSCGVFIKNVPVTEGYALYNSASPRVLLMHVQPRHVALCKSIVGDTSDNYKGVKGFGPAKFLHLYENYGLDGLDELCEIVDKDNFNGALKEAIEQTNDSVLRMLYDNKSEWKLGWKLANINPNLVEARKGNKFNRLHWIKRLPDPERVTALLNVNGCRHLVARLQPLMPKKTLITADNLPDLSRFDRVFKESPIVALDWETSDKLQNPAFQEVTKGREFVDQISSDITGAGLTFGRNLEHTVYMSFDHKDTANLPRQVLLEVLDLIPDNIPVAIHNKMFEINVLKSSLGVSLANIHDTMVMASYVDENELAGLKEQSKLRLNYKQTRYEDVIEEGMRMCDYPATHVFDYGADDPLVTAHLYDLYKMIMQIEKTWDFCVENEFDAIDVLSDGFLAGVSVDWDELDRQAEEDRETYNAAMGRVRELLAENQTPESIESGVNRLYEEDEQEVRLKAVAKFEKDAEGKDYDPVTYDTGQDQYVGEALSAHKEKLIKLCTYAPYEIKEKEKAFELTVSSLKPVLQKLGLPELKDVKSQQALSTYAQENRGVSREADMFLELMVPAAAYNDTAKNKIAKGEGRAHPVYQEFKTYGLQFVEAKTEATGSELNLGSPQQMKALLYGMLDLPIRMRGFEVSDTRQKLGIETPTVQANEDALITALAEDCFEFPWKKEALENLLKAKKCQTRLSLFYDVYPKWRHPADGLIHPQIKSCGTETRRPSGSSPNALQWPKRGEGVKFRRCILPNAKLGHDLVVSIDWSQQELRIAGALSRDEAFLDCYIGQGVEHAISAETWEILGDALMNKFLQTGTKDIHTQTATGLLKWAYEEVIAALEGDDKELAKKAKNARTTAKPINFGGTYGIGAAKLARQLICTFEEAKRFLADKKALYHGFERWREQVIDEVNRLGYVTTALGNRRHAYNEVTSPDDNLRAAIYRQVVNYLIQGLAADNLKRTLTEIHRQGILPRCNATLIAPIYDEVVFSVHHSNVVDLILSVHKIMTRDIPGLPVPMLAEPSLGVNFGDQVEIGAFPTAEGIIAAYQEAFGMKSEAQAA